MKKGEDKKYQYLNTNEEAQHIFDRYKDILVDDPSEIADSYTSFEFSPITRRITGQTEYASFNTKIYLKIIAFDGYKYREDDIIIEVNKIPPAIFMVWTSSILSGLLSILGTYKYRAVIHGILFKKAYKFDTIYVQEETEF